MRKELKSKSRRKWLLGGSLAFASVALLTTGFATWVIGVHQPSGDGQADIDVDTVEDESVELTFSLAEDKIFVAEGVGNSNPNLTIKRKTGTDREPDWNIEIEKLNIVVGKTLFDSLKAKKVDGQVLDLKIVFELQKDVANDKNSVTKDKDLVGVRGGLTESGEQTESSWNYIKLVKNEFTFTLPDSYPAGGKIYDINDTLNNPDKTFSFDWGSYFGETDPSQFYQKNEKNRKEGQSLHDYYQIAGQEFEAMRAALTGKLKLTATFDYGQNGQTVGK